MSENDKCLVCGDYSLEDIQELEKNKKGIYVCPDHLRLDIANGYCMECKKEFGMDSTIFAMLSGRSEYLHNPELSQGDWLVFSHACLLCNKESVRKEREVHRFLFHIPIASEKKNLLGN